MHPFEIIVHVFLQNIVHGFFKTRHDIKEKRINRKPIIFYIYLLIFSVCASLEKNMYFWPELEQSYQFFQAQM